MTDWTQRIEELKFCDEYGVEQEGVKALMNEYAIERLEELKGYNFGVNITPSEYAVLVVRNSEIVAMQERLAKGGME